MVGRLVLVQLIGVRVPVPQQASFWYLETETGLMV